MMSRTEQTIISGIKNGNEWFVCKDGKRELRIGYVLNCNDELPKNPKLLIDTTKGMNDFVKNNMIKKFNIKTVDNKYEYSVCLKICEDEYQRLKNNLRNTLKCA